MQVVTARAVAGEIDHHAVVGCLRVIDRGHRAGALGFQDGHRIELAVPIAAVVVAAVVAAVAVGQLAVLQGDFRIFRIAGRCGGASASGGHRLQFIIHRCTVDLHDERDGPNLQRIAWRQLA